MDVGEGPSHIHHAPSTREETIQVGHTVLLKIPSGDVRTIKVEANSYDASPYAFGPTNPSGLQHNKPQQIWVISVK